MRAFLLKLILRLILFFAIVFLCFFIKHEQGYYLSIMQESSYKKIPWIYDKLNTDKVDSTSILFFGGSLCQHAINDSLLSKMGNYNYLNMGVNQSCNGLTYSILKDILKKAKPRKVYLNLQYTAIKGTHKMYPFIADAGDIIKSCLFSNVEMLSNIYTRSAWNINYYTDFLKFPITTGSHFDGTWGNLAHHYSDSGKIKTLYEVELPGLTKLFEAQKNPDNNAQGLKKMYRKLFMKKLYYLDNVNYQNKMYEQCMQLLDEHKVDYDILLYPTLPQVMMENSSVTINYYKDVFSNTAFSKHKILFVQSDDLKSYDLWEDLNHLNKKGSEIYSSLLLKELEKN